MSLSREVIFLLIIVVSSEARECTKPTDCRNDELMPVYEHGEQVTLALAWSSDADRAALALLYWVLRDQGYCRVSLCETTSLCDLFDNPASYNITNGLVIGYNSAKNGICHKGHLDVVGTSSVLYDALANSTVEPSGHNKVGSPKWSKHNLWSEKERLFNHARKLYRNLELYKRNESILMDLLVLESKKTKTKGLSETAIETVDKWKINNQTLFNNIATAAEFKPVQYIIMAYKCHQDNAVWDLNLLGNLKTKINNKIRKLELFIQLLISESLVDCQDRYDLSQKVEKYYQKSESIRLIGVIAAGAGVVKAAQLATQQNFSLVSYDTQPKLAGEDYISLLTAGPRANDIAGALERTLETCGWRRIALLSEDTPLAEAVAEVLRVEFILKEINIPQDTDSLKATLHALKAANARVIVVNSGIAQAANVLAVAAELEMTRARGYMWVVREAPLHPPLPLLALRAVDYTAARPPLASSVITLMLGFANTVAKNKRLRYDHHTKETLKLLRQNLKKIPTMNIAGQDLKFDCEGVVQPSVFLEEYDNDVVRPHSIQVNFTCPVIKLSDGTPNCSLLINKEDAFALGTCVDLALILGLPMFLLIVMVTVRICMVWRSKLILRRKDREHIMRAEACTALMERQSGALVPLADFHVERSRIHLLHELGMGQHGRVWLAQLDRTRLVAAKVPHSGCAPVEESELLREAATLAGLSHENVVSLVGVCVVGGPPLLLTAMVHFGDLQGYLQQRRGFVGAAHEEAKHVSTAALTRLAREAALALAYLTSKGLVHCDVRAANCLIDERRSLKLADFGMARVLGTGEGAQDDEYQCQSKKLVPFRWMPPESLTQGLFSPASDVWALGVLVLELITLGERPFGALGSHEVVALVRAGGYARLPLSCTVDTRRLALACWQRLPVNRPSAASVAAWLAEFPNTLKPTPHINITPIDGDSDSGIGEASPLDLPIDRDKCRNE